MKDKELKELLGAIWVVLNCGVHTHEEVWRLMEAIGSSAVGMEKWHEYNPTGDHNERAYEDIKRLLAPKEH